MKYLESCQAYFINQDPKCEPTFTVCLDKSAVFTHLEITRDICFECLKYFLQASIYCFCVGHRGLFLYVMAICVIMRVQLTYVVIADGEQGLFSEVREVRG